MLKIIMWDGNCFEFKDEEFTEYELTKDLVIVKKNEQWVGIFNREHFVSLVYNDENTTK